MSRTNFHGPEHVRGIEVSLYMYNLTPYYICPKTRTRSFGCLGPVFQTLTKLLANVILKFLS